MLNTQTINIKNMKKIILILSALSCIISGYSQEFKDLIVTNANDSIHCTITLLKNNYFFYDHKIWNGEIVNDKMQISKTKYYSLASNKSLQTLNDTTAQKEYLGEKYIYCEIIGTTFPFRVQVEISIDYGQKRNFFQDNMIRDESGKMQTFNSMIDALNYMGNQGWEVVQSYIVNDRNLNTYHHLLKRKK